MKNEAIKSEMLEVFSFIRLEMANLLEELSEDRKQERGSMQKWSIRDMLSHLAFWGDHFNRQLEAARDGIRVPEAGDYYEILNDGILLRNLDKPFETAQKEEQAAFAKTITLLEAESLEDLLDPKKYAFMNGRSLLDRALGTECWHVAAHISDYYLGEGQYNRAEKLQEAITAKLMDFPSWKGNAYYNLACFYSLHGKKELALKNLELAFKERPDLKEWSKKDPDITPICEEAGYRSLVD